MSKRRKPSEHFLRRLKDSRKPNGRLPIPASFETSSTDKSISGTIGGIGKIVFLAVEFAAAAFVIPTAYMVIVDLQDRQIQRVNQAWQLITSIAPGSSGKGPALEYLNSEDCYLQDDATRLEAFWTCGFSALFLPPKQREDLQGIDLSTKVHSTSVYLMGVQLQEAFLREANFSGAYLREANLSKAFLPDANLSRVDLLGADLSDTYLSGADLSGAILMRADLSGASLQFANLSGAFFGKGYFVDNLFPDLSEEITSVSLSANLSEADFSSGNLTGADLSGSDLSKATFVFADLSGADLTDSDLSGTDLSGATLKVAPPFEHTLSCESLMEQSYCFFPWPPNAQSGAIYHESFPPKLDPTLLAHLMAVSDECLWVEGLYRAECAVSSISKQ